LHSVSVNVEPEQYLAGWRADAGALFVPALSEARVGDQAAVRVGIYGQTIRATLFGRISLVRRIGRPALPPGVELQLDRASLAAAGFLAMAARGEPVTFRERTARYAVERRVTVEHASVPFETSTLNVSEGGCAVRWPGQLPLVGDVVLLRLGDGIFGSTARAVVCWNQPGGATERSVGLRVIAEGWGGRAWRGVVKSVAKEGTHAA
jgi:Tfp pilus assembly protein PilZ